MEILNTLNLTRISGGTKLKQGDFGSVLSYSLANENGQEITSFDTKTAYINLVLDDKILFTTTTKVDISRVTFHIDKAIPTGFYYLEIKIGDYIFPSDKDSVILIEEGATAYDLKDLIPNYDVTMTITTILSDLAQKGMNITDLQTKVNAIYDKAIADNAEIIQARGEQSSLDTRFDGLDTKDADLQNQVNTNKSSISSIDSRLGSIVASAGNGSVPSELVDARTLDSNLSFTIAGDALRYVNDKIDKSIDNILDKVISTVHPSEIPDVNIIDGYYDQGLLPLVQYASYTTYTFTPTEDITFYFEQLVDEYMTVTVYSDSTMKNIVTTRTKHLGKSTDFSTIPTVDKPLFVKQGLYVVVSLNKTSTAKIISTDYSKLGVKLSNTISMSDNQIEQIKKETSKRCYIKYTGGTNQEVNIYIPAKVGYVRYLFHHWVKSKDYSDKWRMQTTHAVNDDFSHRYDISSLGEWEMAITLEGRPDFIGGSAHGDELQTSFYALVDGNLTDITTLTNMTSFNHLTFIGTSDMLDPNDNVTKVGEHGVEHTFTKDGMIIKQTVNWLWNGKTTTAFMAMLPIAKANSDKFYTNKSMKLMDIAGEIRENGITEVNVFKSSLGLSVKYGIKEYPGLEMFMIIDNGGGPYNKCYYKINPQTVAIGDVWKSETYYSFEIGK